MSSTVGLTSENRAALLMQELKRPRPIPSRRETEAPAIRAKITAAAQLARIKARANAVLKAGSEHNGELKKAYANFRPDKYREFSEAARDRLVEWLKKENEAVEQDLADFQQTFARPAAPMPSTTTEAVNLNSKITILTNASPSAALAIVRDAAQRGDQALLTAARAIVEGGKHRNSWQAPEGTKAALDIFDTIDAASWSPDVEAATVAAEQVESYRQGWQFLLGTLTKGDGHVDDVYLNTNGVFGPLLESSSAGEP